MTDLTNRFDLLWRDMDRKEKNHVRRKVQTAMKSASRITYAPQSSEILNFLNEKAEKNFRHVSLNYNFIVSRLNDGITVEQLKGIIVRRCRDWKGTDMDYCLRPSTLFNAEKCEQYLGELG